MKNFFSNILTIFALFVLNTAVVFAQNDYDIKELSIEINQFKVVGNLYMPYNEMEKYPVVIFVTGDGNYDRNQATEMLKKYGYFEIFINMGFGILVYDKPGSGASSGEFNKGKILTERSQILSEWIIELAQIQEVNQDMIGLAGGSQGGYVMPLTYGINNNIAFFICQSCPAENGINQSAYLLYEQSLCIGIGESEAKITKDHYVNSCKTDNYSDYLSSAEYLAKHPIVKALGWNVIFSKEEFEQNKNQNHDQFYDPQEDVAKINIPMLVLYGGKDKFVNSTQGYSAYKKIFKNNGRDFSEVHLFEGLDHLLGETKDGCYQEIMVKRNNNELEISPKVKNVVIDWLKRLIK